MKYSKNFNRDFNWYLSVRDKFNFFGSEVVDIIYDRNGIDGKQAFYIWDSQGKMVPTKHPNILKTLFITKGSVNLFIKMYAEDRAFGILPKELFYSEVVLPFKCPDWFVNAVENQKVKYYDKIDFKSLLKEVVRPSNRKLSPGNFVVFTKREAPLVKRIPKYLYTSCAKDNNILKSKRTYFLSGDFK